MADSLTPGQTAYAAYGRTTNNLNHRGLPMPAWGDLGDTIREAWENAAAATSRSADEAVRGVQGWMALDLHTALGRPVDHAATNQGHDSWGDWWAQLCADVRAVRQPEAPARPEQPLRQRIAEALLADLRRAVPPLRQSTGAYPIGGMARTEYDLADAVLAVVQAELDARDAENQQLRRKYKDAVSELVVRDSNIQQLRADLAIAERHIEQGNTETTKAYAQLRSSLADRDRLAAENQRLRGQLAALGLVRVWRNEDGNEFMFANEVRTAIGCPTRAAGPRPTA
jgi:hypothetical protein